MSRRTGREEIFRRTVVSIERGSISPGPAGGEQLKVEALPLARRDRAQGVGVLYHVGDLHAPVVAFEEGPEGR